MTEETRTRITDVRTVSVPVTDQDRALEFYTGKLGFEKRLDVPYGDEGQRWIEVAPAGAATTLALVPPGQGGHAGIDTGIRFMTDDAEADHADLQARGVDEGEVQHWEGVPPMFSLRDPDGNRLYIVERMAA
jgi:catechol 2,3-dioxygenase-like lactoylglutathione lyase family enzyme